MIKVRVDFNSRGPNGTLRGSQRRASGDLVVGSEVELTDPEEPDLKLAAVVSSLDAASGRALFALVPAQAPERPHITFQHSFFRFSGSMSKVSRSLTLTGTRCRV